MDSLDPTSGVRGDAQPAQRSTGCALGTDVDLDRLPAVDPTMRSSASVPVDETVLRLTRRFFDLCTEINWPVLGDLDPERVAAVVSELKVPSPDGQTVFKPLLTFSLVLPSRADQSGCVRAWNGVWRLIEHVYPGSITRGCEARMSDDRLCFVDGFDRAPGLYVEIIDVGFHSGQNERPRSPFLSVGGPWKEQEGLGSHPDIGLLIAALLHPDWARSLRTLDQCLWLSGYRYNDPVRTEEWCTRPRLEFSRERGGLVVSPLYHNRAEPGIIVPARLAARRIVS